MSWYAIRLSTPNADRFVTTALAEVGLTAYSPQHVTWARHAKRKATRSRPLIPGYLFAELPDDDAIQAAFGIRGVNRHAPILKLRVVDVGALILADAFHAFDETWEPPRPKGRRYSHAWKRGDRVTITAGAFEGHVCQVVRARGAKRMEVLLTLFGRVQEVVVEHRVLARAA